MVDAKKYEFANSLKELNLLFKGFRYNIAMFKNALVYARKKK